MLRNIIICVVLLSSFVMSLEAQTYAYGTVLRDDVQFTCDGPGPQCADDCSTLMLCAQKFTEPFAKVNCPSSSPLTPYCVGNSCSASPGNCSSASSFRCTSSGIFPDPSDCFRYRYCNESNVSSTIFGCPTGFIFNSKINICEKSSSKICNKIDCAQKSNEIIVYKDNPAYYAFCFVAPNGTRETIMFKCEFEQYEIFDISENMCKFNCKSAGHYQDPSDCRSYYICSGTSGSTQVQKIQCPLTYYFDGAKCTQNSSNCSPGSLSTTTTTTTTTLVSEMEVNTSF